MSRLERGVTGKCGNPSPSSSAASSNNGRCIRRGMRRKFEARPWWPIVSQLIVVAMLLPSRSTLAIWRSLLLSMTTTSSLPMRPMTLRYFNLPMARSDRLYGETKIIGDLGPAHLKRQWPRRDSALSQAIRDSGLVVQSTNVLTAEAGRRCWARERMIRAAAPRTSWPMLRSSGDQSALLDLSQSSRPETFEYDACSPPATLGEAAWPMKRHIPHRLQGRTT